MEEQKSKEVKMNPENGQQKLTYDQLKEVADKLWNDNRYLRQELQKATEFANTINRLDYLFKVVEFANREGAYNFSSEFTAKCFEEIEKLLTVPEETSEETNKEN
jgi:hypothetical protein